MIVTSTHHPKKCIREGCNAKRRAGLVCSPHHSRFKKSMASAQEREWEDRHLPPDPTPLAGLAQELERIIEDGES
jgi:hypothetical protein